MSHTDRINEDENELHELQNQVDKIVELKQGYMSQREEIVSLQEMIAKLQSQNKYLREKQQFHIKIDTESLQKTDEPDYCSIGEGKKEIPRSFRLASLQPKVGLQKSNSQFIRTRQTIDDRQIQYQCKNNIIENFVDDLKLELNERDRSIAREKSQNDKIKQKYQKYKQQNEKLKLLNEKFIDKNDLLVRENQMLKQQILLQTELRYSAEVKLKQSTLVKRDMEVSFERELMKMDKIYDQFQKKNI